MKEKKKQSLFTCGVHVEGKRKYMILRSLDRRVSKCDYSGFDWGGSSWRRSSQEEGLWLLESCKLNRHLLEVMKSRAYVSTWKCDHASIYRENLSTITAGVSPSLILDGYLVCLQRLPKAAEPSRPCLDPIICAPETLPIWVLHSCWRLWHVNWPYYPGCSRVPLRTHTLRFIVYAAPTRMLFTGMWTVVKIN